MILASIDLPATTNTLIFKLDKVRSNLTINFADRGGTDQTLRCWIIPNDVTLANKHAWLYGRPLPANGDFALVLDKITLQLGTEIWAYVSVGNVSVNVAD